MKPGAEWDESEANDSCQACAEVSLGRFHEIEEEECQHGKHWRVKKVRPQTHSFLSAKHDGTPFVVSEVKTPGMHEHGSEEGQMKSTGIFVWFASLLQEVLKQTFCF